MTSLAFWVHQDSISIGLYHCDDFLLDCSNVGQVLCLIAKVTWTDLALLALFSSFSTITIFHQDCILIFEKRLQDLCKGP